MQRTQKIIIGVLVVLAVALGVAIYFKNTMKAPADSNNQTLPPPPPASQNNNTPANIKALTEEETKLLQSTPKENATNDEKDAHALLAANLAVSSDQLTINGCAAAPVVVKIPLNDTLNVTNSGSSSIEFGFDKDKLTTVAAGQSAKVKIDFKNGVGLYGYGCADASVQRPIGFLMVTPS